MKTLKYAGLDFILSDAMANAVVNFQSAIAASKSQGTTAVIRGHHGEQRNIEVEIFVGPGIPIAVLRCFEALPEPNSSSEETILQGRLEDLLNHALDE